MNALAIQAAIFQELQGPMDGFLASMITPDGNTLDQPGIYDHVPHQVDDQGHYPYLVVGDDTSIPFDTDDSVGSEATITLHIWSRARGRSEVKQIQGAVYDALHRNSIAVSGTHTVDVAWEFADTILETDGITRHGVMRFRFIVEEA